jgi:YHS domain-containing protein
MEVLGYIFVCLFAYGFYSDWKKDKQLKAQPPLTNIYFGDEIAILGHKFTPDANYFYWDESKTYWFCQQGNVNYFGTFPNIFITQDEFFKRLDNK